MTPPPGATSRIGRVALATLIHAALVLGPLAGYLVYQQGHAQRVEAAHFRAVAALAAETTQRLNHLRHLFAYAAGRSAGGSEPWLANARLTEPQHTMPAVAPAGDAAGTCAEQGLRFELQPGASPGVRLRRSVCAAWQTWCACPPLPWPGGAGSAPAGCDLPEAVAQTRSFDHELGAQLARYDQADMLHPGAMTAQGLRCGAGVADGGLDATAVAAALGAARELRVPVADLLARTGGDERFRALALLRTDGTVVYATDATWPAQLRIAGGAAQAADADAVASARARAGVWFETPLPLRRAGDQEMLFCVPLAVPYADAPELALCGSVPQAALARSARALAPDLLALVVLVFLLSVCAVPLLKVWLIGPHEAFRRGDLALAVAGVLAGAALVTVLVAWAGWTLSWGARLDTAARELTTQVRTAFGQELAQTLPVLDRLATPGADAPAVARALPAWGRLAFVLDGSGQQLGALGTAGGLGPLAAPAAVANRAYFRQALAGGGVPLAPGGPLAGLEHIVMRGHGIKATALAMRVDPGADPAQVAVLLRRFASLDAPLVPRGFSVIVFDATDGAVQMHSDAGRALAENFYTETGTPALAAHLREGRPFWLDADYAGGSYRFRMTPLRAGWPWWVAVGRDQRLWRAAGFDLVAGALPSAGMLIALLCATGLVLGYGFARLGRGASGTHALAWMWPQWGRRYWMRAAVLAGLAAASLAALVWLPSDLAVACALGLAMAGAAVFTHTARRAAPLATDADGHPARGFLSCAALLLLLGGVLPTAAVVRDIGAWVESGYQRLVLRDYARAGATAPGPGRYLPPALIRRADPYDVPPARATVHGACQAHPGACVLSAGVAPDLMDAHVTALRKAAASPPAHERADAARRCQPAGDPAGPWVCAPRLAGFWPPGRAGVGLGLLALVLGWAAVRVLGGAAERVFALSMGGGRLPGLSDEGLRFPDQGHVLVVRAPAEYAARLARALGGDTPALRVRRVDLRAAETNAQGQPHWPAALSAHADVVVLEQFDARARDAQWSLARLELLERLLLRAGPRVVVLSDMSDPARVALDCADPQQADALAARWAAVLGELKLLRYPPPAAPVPGHGAALDVLARETSWSWRLDGVAQALREQPGFADLSARAAAAEVAARAWAHYRHLWSLCTHAERLALAQLAHGAQINPRQRAVVTQLLRRGLVRRAPEFRLAGECFADFVCSELSSREVLALEQARPGGTWQAWRAPLLVGVLVGGALLFVTQRDTFQAAYALGAAGLTAIPVLFRLVQTLRGAGQAIGGGAPPPTPRP